MEDDPLDLEPIRARLIQAGYPRPGSGQQSSKAREVSREAQQARAELRDHIIDDVWALLDEVEHLRRWNSRPRDS